MVLEPCENRGEYKIASAGHGEILVSNSRSSPLKIFLGYSHWKYGNLKLQLEENSSTCASASAGY